MSRRGRIAHGRRYRAKALQPAKAANVTCMACRMPNVPLLATHDLAGHLTPEGQPCPAGARLEQGGAA